MKTFSFAVVVVTCAALADTNSTYSQPAFIHIRDEDDVGVISSFRRMLINVEHKVNRT